MPYHTYQIEVSDLQFLVEYFPEYFMGEPWKEEDGHGPVSDWTTRAKECGFTPLTVAQFMRLAAKTF